MRWTKRLVRTAYSKGRVHTLRWSGGTSRVDTRFRPSSCFRQSLWDIFDLGGGIMTRQHLIWLITLAGFGLLALVFIFSDQLPRVPFVFT